MRISARKVYFIISEEETGPRRPLVWCELPVSFYFNEYNLVGVNKEYNEIYLEVPTGKRLDLNSLCNVALIFSLTSKISWYIEARC